MRWEQLFEDLEAQLEAAAAAELVGEVADRTRRELAQTLLADRVTEAVGAIVTVTVRGAGVLRGRLLDSGPDWWLVDDAPEQLLVPAPAVLSVVGLSRRSADPSATTQVGRALDLRWALRGIARTRAGVRLVLVDGSVLSGTLDRVGADHLDLAEHGQGEVRRGAAVRQVRTVPLGALGVVRTS